MWILCCIYNYRYMIIFPDNAYVALLTMQSVFRGQSKWVMLTNARIFMMLYIWKEGQREQKIPNYWAGSFFVVVH